MHSLLPSKGALRQTGNDKGRVCGVVSILIKGSSRAQQGSSRNKSHGVSLEWLGLNVVPGSLFRCIWLVCIREQFRPACYILCLGQAFVKMCKALSMDT